MPYAMYTEPDRSAIMPDLIRQYGGHQKQPCHGPQKGDHKFPSPLCFQLQGKESTKYNSRVIRTANAHPKQPLHVVVMTLSSTKSFFPFRAT